MGASHEANQLVYQYDFTGPVPIILGGEGRGLRRLTQERCDSLVKIPMLGRVSSLNVSVATGILGLGFFCKAIIMKMYHFN